MRVGCVRGIGRRKRLQRCSTGRWGAAHVGMGRRAWMPHRWAEVQHSMNLINIITWLGAVHACRAWGMELSLTTGLNADSL